MKKRIKIVFPVFNDWEALSLLLEQIVKYCGHYDMSFLAVDDCSSQSYDPKVFSEYNLKVIHLISNVGHQRAIAIGLSYLADHNDYDKVIVMDSDGEDKPEHILDLIAQSELENNMIVFAQRKKRSESFMFKTFYIVYKFIFKFLTGRVITFGNFSCIPADKIKKISHVSEIWNNYPGGIIRSRLPFTAVSLDRGKRLAGESKMNFSSLILHGMSAISVFLDFTAVRILIFASVMILCSFVGSGVVLYYKFILQEATPGWASNLILGFFVIFIQGFFISLFILFMVLSSRRYTGFVPYLGYKKYIDTIS